MFSVFLKVFVLLGVPAIVSTMLTWWNLEKNSFVGKKSGFVVFFILVYFVLLSIGKIILGYSKNTLLETFTEIGKMTFIHYWPILLVVSVVLPVLFLKLLDKDKMTSYVSNFISFFLLLSILKLLVSHYIYNLDVCIFAIISISVALIRREKQDINVSKGVYIQRLKISVPVALFVSTTLFIYLPSTLYIVNSEEFHFSPLYYFGILFLYSIIIILLYSLLFSWLAVPVDFTIVNVSLGIFTFCGYVQTNFLNGKMMSLDGNEQEWTQFARFSNIFIWIILIIILLTGLIVVKYKATKLYIFAMYSLVAMQIVSLTGLIVSHDWSNNHMQYYLSTEHTLDVDDKNNIIVFVLDWFDEKLVENLYVDEPQAFEEFKDFTWYQNTTSRYAFTGESVPYLLTGVEKPSDINDDDYVGYAYEHSDYGRMISDLKYDVAVCTTSSYVRHPFADLVINYQKRKDEKYDSNNLFLTMLDCTNYSILPFVLKGYYYYTSINYSIINGLKDEVDNECDFEFGKKLFDEGIRIVDKDSWGIKGALRFYHLWGAHSPYNIDRNANLIWANGSRPEEALGCLSIVSEFIKQMKAADLYEDATIIITADHGQNIYLDDPKGAEKEKLQTTSNPVFMIKKSGAAVSEKIKVSTAPISHAELMPTVFEAMGLDGEKIGKTVDEIGVDDERIRLFTFGRTPDIPYVTYEINGDVRDKKNWTKKN